MACLGSVSRERTSKNIGIQDMNVFVLVRVPLPARKETAMYRRILTLTTLTDVAPEFGLLG